ncbi:hypothetical protein ACP70R_015191 [Stipagrostis hirtigluma subsp. patula]
MAPPPPACRRRPSSPPALMDELVEEILLRVPPDEPAHLVRAAAVCRPWRRIVSIRPRPYDDISVRTQFVPTSPAYAFTPPADARRSWRAHDCRHGRVLITGRPPLELIVWDPITGDQQELSVPAYPYAYYTTAVLCAVDGCDHLDCHGGPFRVVFVGWDINNMESVTWASIYSSETGAWSASTSIQLNHIIEGKPSLLFRNTLYFTLEQGKKFLKYDLAGHKLSEIDTPSVFGAMVVKTKDRGLGFVWMLHNRIYLLSKQDDAIGIAGLGWTKVRFIELETLLPKMIPSSSRYLIGSAEGTDIVFVHMDAGVFALDLDSGKVRRVGESGPRYAILPYMSTYTPDLAKGRL